MSAFSDSATNQLHITSRTGVTAEGKPSTVISTAYYRIPFQRLLKGSTHSSLPAKMYSCTDLVLHSSFINHTVLRQYLL